MPPVISNFTMNGPGNVTITDLPAMPRSVEFWVGQKDSTTENFAHLSYGISNGTKQFVHSVVQGKTISLRDRCIQHLDSSGNPVIKAKVVEFQDHGGGVYGFEMYFNASNGGYTIDFVARF